MGILGKIREVLFGSATGEIRDPMGIYIYAKCDRCGAPVRIRVDKAHDLQRDYDTGGFILHKEIMDGTCFALMQATVRFSARYAIVESEVEGGRLISWEEYRALSTGTISTPAAR
ncbi:MAG: hypothetical protein JXC32_10150 [Anaerolineae bacterium]|nr:hypothetical protein [Anaerolineae bacterium]